LLVVKRSAANIACIFSSAIYKKNGLIKGNWERTFDNLLINIESWVGTKRITFGSDNFTYTNVIRTLVNT